MTGIYYPCSRFTSQSVHFCDIFSKCKFVQIHVIVQCRISCNLGPGSAVGGKGKKRGQIGKISASEASQVVSWGGGREAEHGDSLWCRRSMIPDSGIMLWLVKRLHVDGFAVLLTVSCSFNTMLIQFGGRFFKTWISSMQYKFLCEAFRLSLGAKKIKTYACDKRKRGIQNMELF